MINFVTEKLNKALESARGYYEMLLSSESTPKTVLRLNLKAFRNNYNLSDLTKMKLLYYAVKVGECDIDKLDISKEFDLSKNIPTAEDVVGDCKVSTTNKLDVYDVVLAGVKL